MSDLYLKLNQQARLYDRLYHYTTLDNLKIILGNMSFRLSRLDKVNDSEENSRVDELLKQKIFILCFTHDGSESVCFWEEYAKGKRGIRLSLDMNKLKDFNNIELYVDEICSVNKLEKIERSNVLYDNYEKASDWGINNITFSDVEYVESLIDYRKFSNDLYEEFKDCIRINNEKFWQSINPGLIKTIKWKDEKETRIRVALRPKGKENIRIGDNMIAIYPSFEYIYLKLKSEFLNGSTITLNPWADKDFYDEVNNFLVENNISQVINVENSIL